MSEKTVFVVMGANGFDIGANYSPIKVFTEEAKAEEFARGWPTGAYVAQTTLAE